MAGVKFSQFTNGGQTVAGDEFVGLRAGANTRFSVPGFRKITQTAHGLSVGNVLRFNGAIYVVAQANSAANSDVIGIITSVIDANTFTLSFGGYISGLSALVAGSTYFLSAAVAGSMTATAPTTPGEVRKPLLIADSTTTGYWFNYNGQVL